MVAVKRRFINIHLVIILTSVIILIHLFIKPVQAAIFDTPCSVSQLMADLNTANSNQEPDTINLAPNCLYLLTSTLVILNDGSSNGITFNGQGATLSGSNLTRIFQHL